MLVVLHVVLLSADGGVKSTFATDNEKLIVEKMSVTILDDCPIDMLNVW